MVRNRILVLTLSALSLLYIYFIGGFIPYIFFNVLIATILISLAYTFYVYFSLRCKQFIDKPSYVKGDTATFILLLKNRGLLVYPLIQASFYEPINLLKGLTKTQRFAIMPFSTKKVSFSFECKYRGEYEVGLKSIQIEDFFSIFRLKRKTTLAHKVLILPKIVCIDRFIFNNNLSGSSFMAKNDSPNEDVTVIKDIRNYSYGDSFKKIHWNLTAKSNELMVKDFQSTADTKINILLNLHKNSYTDEINLIIEDKLVEVAVAILYYYLTKNLSITFAYFHNELNVLSASTMAEFNEIYKDLALLPFSNTVAINDIFNLCSQSSTISDDFIILTCQFTLDLYNEASRAKLSGKNMCIIYVSPKSLIKSVDAGVQDMIDDLRNIGVNTLVLDVEDDIKMKLEV